MSAPPETGVARAARTSVPLPQPTTFSAGAASLSLLQPRTAVPLHRGQALILERPFDAPDPADLTQVRRWVRSAPRPTAVDLFCGAGGLGLGLQDAGFSVVVGADSDPRCVQTHVANLRGLGYVGDLADPADLLAHLSAWGITSADLVAGGVPCQPFSRAGQSKLRSLVDQGVRSHDDPRIHLWSGFLSVVSALRPRAVLLENVPDLATWDDGAVLIGIREGLRDLGYWTDTRLLDAQAYCVPQHRSRLFTVGFRSREGFFWPASTGRFTVRDAIGDLPKVPGGQVEETIPYGGPPTTELQSRLRRGVATDLLGVIHDHMTRAVRPDDAQAFALLGPGQTYQDLPSHLQRYRSDIFTDKYKRMAWDDLGRTITAHMAKDGYWYIHPSQDRTLSIREAARLQTFPDWYRFAGHPSHRYRQIGNAVPPLLAEALGRELRLALGRSGRPETSRRSVDAREELLGWHSKKGRAYPWRTGADPWHVLIAEMCLHRTRADQVVPVYQRLVRLAPTPRALLVNADAARRAMQPLGLWWRVRNILDVARVLQERFEGVVPSTSLELRSLPGVGDYVAGAVLCFAFGRRAVLLDTNTERIVGRVRGGPRGRRMQMRLDLYDLAGQEGPDRDFNYALLDLGALVCRPEHPDCSRCPIGRACATGSDMAASALGVLRPELSLT
ncbi:MAG: DNA (cytosine-5-)-methyltransferase [Candidatus Dormibacteria bacterium]